MTVWIPDQSERIEQSLLCTQSPPPEAAVYVLDGLGGVHAGGGAPVLSPSTPYFGFDIARDLELQ